MVVSQRERHNLNGALGQELKSSAWIKNIVNRFSKPSHLVVDPCVEHLPSQRLRYSAEPLSISWMWNRRKVLPGASHLVGATFLRLIVSEDANVNALCEIIEAVKVILRAPNNVTARKRKVVWEVLPNQFPTYTFQSHISHFLSTQFEDSGRSQMGSGVLLLSWWAK